jgi:hypothetical protein
MASGDQGFGVRHNSPALRFLARLAIVKALYGKTLLPIGRSKNV